MKEMRSTVDIIKFLIAKGMAGGNLQRHAHINLPFANV